MTTRRQFNSRWATLALLSATFPRLAAAQSSDIVRVLIGFPPGGSGDNLAPDQSHPIGGFCCQHSHRDQFHINELLGYVGVQKTQARNRPVIRLVPGDALAAIYCGPLHAVSSGARLPRSGGWRSVWMPPTLAIPAALRAA